MSKKTFDFTKINNEDAEVVFIKDSDGKSHYEFFIDDEKDVIVFDIMSIKGKNKFIGQIDIPVGKVYDVYRLLEKYLKTEKVY